MFKKIIAALAVLLASTAFAAVDANKAMQAELESIKGIGPAISGAIIEERKKGDFKDWNDLVVRVKGVGEHNAATFSTGGLTVGGKTFTGVAPTAAAAKPATPAKTAAEAPKETAAAKAGHVVKADAEKAASAVTTAGKHVKEDVKEQKDAAKENVAEAKAKSAEKKAEKAEKKAEKSAAASASAAKMTKAEKAEAKSAAASASAAKK
jgi:competence protein ComEA